MAPGVMRSSMVWAVLAFLGGGQVGEAFFPGLGPEVYELNAKLPLYVNELTSTHKPVPLDHYHMGYCKPDNLKERTENLGAYLEGDREETSLYNLRVGKARTCAVLCAKTLSVPERYMFSSVIHDGYLAHMTVNTLPAAYMVRDTNLINEASSGNPVGKEPVFLRGFPVGFMKDGSDTAYLNNHLRITVAINPRNEEETKFHIVGFMVEPFSVKHEYESPYEPDNVIYTCSRNGYDQLDASHYLSTDYEGEVLFTYDLVWDIVPMPWTQRWSIYSIGGQSDNQIHWFSIINSSVIVLFLSVLVGMIIVRALRKDIQRYNTEDMEEAQEDIGWKLVHGDVMRPPTTMPMLFAVCVGTGIHLWTVCFMVLFFSMARLVSPLHRGDMLTVCILMYVLTASIAGYNAARIHRRFRGTEWVKMTTMTALGFPSAVGAIFMVLNVQQWAIGSTGAVPFKVLILLVAMWLLVMTPLTFLGSYYGFRKELPPQIVRTNQIPRMIPQTPWYIDPKVAVPFAGVLPFGAVLVELVFVMTALWEQQPYFISGFLLSVLIILSATCAEISIVMCYFQLYSEDYRWWWRSILWSGSCAGWMFLYSIGYYFTGLSMEGWVAGSLFLGYTFILTGSFFLLTGTLGYFSCQWFINVIYSSIKVD